MSLVFGNKKGVTLALIQDKKTLKTIDKIKLKDKIFEGKEHISTKDNNLKIENNKIIVDRKKYYVQPVLRQVKQQNERLVVLGMSGSGKTMYTKKLLKNSDLDEDIFLFTRNDEDPSIDDLKNMNRIEITEQDILDAYHSGEQLIDIKTLKNSVCIFDDIEEASKLKTAYYERLRDDVAKNGRKLNIDIVSIIHGTDYKKTRSVMSEATSYTFFLGGSDAMNKYVIKQYLGIEKKDYTDLKNKTKGSRWVTISNTYPSILMCEFLVEIF